MPKKEKKGKAAAADAQPEMTEEEMMKKIMDGELPPDYKPPKKAMDEETMRQKMLDGEIDPESASVSVSKSAWRKQKGDMSKKDTEVAQRILDGELPDEMHSVSPDAPVDEAEMMRRIMDGEGPP